MCPRLLPDPYALCVCASCFVLNLQVLPDAEWAVPEPEPAGENEEQQEETDVSTPPQSWRSSPFGGLLGGRRASAKQVRTCNTNQADCRARSRVARHQYSSAVRQTTIACQCGCREGSDLPYSLHADESMPWVHQEDEPEEDLVEDAEEAVQQAAGGLRGFFGGAARKSKAVIEVREML